MPLRWQAPADRGDYPGQGHQEDPTAPGVTYRCGAEGDPAGLAPKYLALRGPPEELFPEGVDETGQDLAVDEDFGMDFVDELPVDDWAA